MHVQTIVALAVLSGMLIFLEMSPRMKVVLSTIGLLGEACFYSGRLEGVIAGYIVRASVIIFIALYMQYYGLG